MNPAASIDRRTNVALVAFVLTVAALGYGWAGSPSLLLPRSEEAPVAAQPDALVQRLAERLAAQPNDADGWAMLGRSYLTLRRADEAVAAYRSALALQPQDPDVLADLTDALALAQGNRLDGEPLALLERALAIDANHVKARVLAGVAAERRGDAARAAAHWQRAIDHGAPGHPLLAVARDGLERVRASGTSETTK